MVSFWTMEINMCASESTSPRKLSHAALQHNWSLKNACITEIFLRLFGCMSNYIAKNNYGWRCSRRRLHLLNKDECVVFGMLICLLVCFLIPFKCGVFGPLHKKTELNFQRYKNWGINCCIMGYLAKVHCVFASRIMK